MSNKAAQRAKRLQRAIEIGEQSLKRLNLDRNNPKLVRQAVMAMRLCHALSQPINVKIGESMEWFRESAEIEGEAEVGIGPPTPSKVLFLDVDGVLNRCGKSNQGLETDKVELLAQIVRKANPAIVVSSTWRIHERQMNRLKTVLKSIGANFIGVTPWHNDKTEGGLYMAKARGNEIQEWMDENGTPERFVILDDDSDMLHLKPRLIKTESFVGLTEEIAKLAIAALNAHVEASGPTPTSETPN